MEPIYTGCEKKIHYILTKRVIKRYSLNIDDIAKIHFACNQPTEALPLWTAIVTIYGADTTTSHYTEHFYLKNCIRHGFSITWANLKKGKF